MMKLEDAFDVAEHLRNHVGWKVLESAVLLDDLRVEDLTQTQRKNQWRRLHTARGSTCPHFYKWQGTGGTVSKEQQTRN